MENIAFIEKDCTFSFQGMAFESGGARIVKCSDNKMRGVVYVNVGKMTVNTWHGDFIAHIDYYTSYRGNFCRMVHITFTIDGIKFIGLYCPDWADACKVWSSKPVMM
jgi:hypothetical protein